MALSTSDLIARIRQQIDDVSGGKSIFQENLTRSRFGNQVNGTNKSFQLANGRVVASSLTVSLDGGAFAAISGSGSSEDTLRGRFVLATATTAPATACLATYDFQFFTDAELTIFLENAASFIGTTDTTFVSVDVGLGDALVYKAASDACSALTTRTAPFYNAGAGGKTAQKGEIAKKYADLSQALKTRADAERLAFYGARKGAATAPAYGQAALGGRITSPYTPRR